MRADPVNRSLVTVAAMLRGGTPTVALLEPGDHTHYGLLLTPAWAPGVDGALDRAGVPPGGRYLLVTRLGDEVRSAWLHEGVLPFDLEPLSHNGWTQELLAWWLNGLWEAIARVEVAAPAEQLT